MGGLRHLYEALGDNEYSRYEANGLNYKMLSIKGDELKILYPAELLQIEKKDLEKKHPIETVSIIAYFGNEPTRVSYVGSASSMKKTLNELRLPSYSENLGELIFRIFRGHLEDTERSEEIPDRFVRAGKEHQFLLVLAKFIHIYSGGRIDAEFYEIYERIKQRRNSIVKL